MSISQSCLKLYVVPEASLVSTMNKKLMLEEKTNASFGNRVVSYTMLLNLIAAEIPNMPQLKIINYTERQLLIQSILFENKIKWPPYLRRSTLGRTLTTVIGEIKSLPYDRQGLIQILNKEILEDNWRIPFLETFNEYERLLKERFYLDKEERDLIIFQYLNSTSKAELQRILAAVYGVDGQEIIVVPVHFEQPDDLCQKIISCICPEYTYGIPQAICEPFISLQNLFQNEPNLKLTPSSQLLLHNALEPRQEAYAIVSFFKDKLLKNSALSAQDCLLVVDNDPLMRKYLWQEFRQQGVPYDLTITTPLSAEPLYQALVSLLQAAMQYDSFDLLSLLRDPLLNKPHPDIEDLSFRIASYWPISGNSAPMESWKQFWHNLLQNDLPDFEEEENQISLNQEFHEAGTDLLLKWQQILSKLKKATSIASLIAEVKVIMQDLDWPQRAIPMNIEMEDYLNSRRRTEAAWTLLQDLFTSLETILSTNSQPLASFLEMLQIVGPLNMLSLRYGKQGGVSLKTVDHLEGQSYKYVVVANCCKGNYPEQRGLDWLISESLREKLGLPDADSYRIQQERKFQALLAKATEVLLFTWSAVDERGNEQKVDLFINQIRIALDTAAVNYKEKIDLETTSMTIWQKKLFQNHVKHKKELARFLQEDSCLWLTDKEKQRLGNIVKLAMERSPEINFSNVEPTMQKALEEALSKHMANFNYSASSFQAYKSCPYRFLIERLLRFKEISLVQEQLSAMERGSLYHQILQEFYYPFCAREELGDNLNVSQKEKRLETLLDEFWQRPFSLRLSPILWQLEKQRAQFILSRYIERKPLIHNGRVLATEWSFGALQYGRTCDRTESCPDVLRDAHGNLKCHRFWSKGQALILKKNEQSIHIKGIIDRIDIQGDRIHLVDYKSGNGGGRNAKSVYNFEDIQLPIYALAWQQNDKRAVKSIAYDFIEQALSSKQLLYLDLDTTWQLEKDQPEKSWLEYCIDLEEHLWQIDARIRKADFRPIVKNEQDCKHCPLNGICQKESLANSGGVENET